MNHLETAYESPLTGRTDNDDALKPVNDLLEYVKQYAREKPEVVALTCLGIGFVLGWKLKPW